MRRALGAGARKLRQVPSGDTDGKSLPSPLPPLSQTDPSGAQCDSKHPRCTACSTAGVPCHQEDRHRQTLIARGHTERIERQLTGCTELLKRHIQGFDLNNLDEFLAREGIELPPLDGPQPPPPFNFQGTPGPGNRGFPLRSEGAPPPIDGSPPRPYPYPPGPPMVHPGYPTPVSVYPYGPPPPHMMPPHPPPGFPHNIHPAFQHTPHHAPPPIQARPPSAHDSNRAEPLPHDLSNSEVRYLVFEEEVVRYDC